MSSKRSLKEYITENKDDSDGSWEYLHTPYIESVLNDLNKTQSEKFSSEIWNWSNYHLYELANPILFCKNENIEGDLLYSKIFARIENIEHLIYLAQNLKPCMAIYGIKNFDVKLLQEIRNNLFFVINNTKDLSRIDCYTQLIEEITKEIEKTTAKHTFKEKRG